jgi:hypothetical protein
MFRLAFPCTTQRSENCSDKFSGQENESQLCSAGDVPNILAGSIANHDGPYDGVEISCAYLTG